MDLDRFYYEVNLNGDKTGMKYNSIVPEPAIEVNYMLFNSEISKEKPVDFGKMYEIYEETEDEMLIHGPIMIPNIDILRKFSDGSGYYNCMFTEKSVENTVKKAAKEGNFNKVSLNHWRPIKNYMTQEAVEGVYLIESFIHNKRAKSIYYENINDGTYFGTYWVEDKNFWKNVMKSGDFHGFSIEIVVDVVEESFIKQEMMRRGELILNSNLSDTEKRDKLIKLWNLDRY